MGTHLPSREFSEYEKNFIEKNCTHMTVGAIRTALGIPWQTIDGYLKRNGLTAKPSPRRSWADDLIQLQLYLDEGHSDEEIAVLMGRTKVAVEGAVKRFNLTRKNRSGKHWTAADDDRLKEDWNRINVRVLARRLGRTTLSVRIRAMYLKLQGAAECDGGMTFRELEEACGVSRKRIERWCTKGFPVRTVKVNERRKYYVVDVEDALAWMKENQDEFDASKIERDALTYEPPWLVAKRNRDIQYRTKAERSAGGINTNVVEKTPWTTMQHKRLVEMCAERKTPQEMANKLDKTVIAIEARIGDFKIPYTHPRFYSTEEKLFIEANYKIQSYEWMAEHLGRKSVAGLKAFCSQQGWFKGSPHYTDEERQFVKDNYLTMTDAEIAATMQGRTKYGIAKLRKSMGIDRKCI